jgi:hypothetical protein
MSKLNQSPRINTPDAALQALLRDHATKVNLLAEGRLSAAHSARASVPTTGTFAQGDQIRNSAPAELGAASSKYVIIGWACVVGGTPGTWVQLRNLTGN